MKKFMVLILVFSVLFSGCGFLQTAQDKLCNPPPEVIAVAQTALPILAALIATLVPGSAEYMAAVSSQGTVTAILAGACVTVTQVNKLIDFLKGAEVAKAMAGKRAVINTQPLTDWKTKSLGK